MSERLKTNGDAPCSLRTIAAINRSQKAAALARSKLVVVKGKLSRMIDEIEDACRVEYTGWMALLRRDGEQWECVACINPDDDRWQDEEIPGFTIMIPIPEPSSVPEFDGF